MVDETALVLVEGTGQIALFRNKQVRRQIHSGEWYFSIVDVIELLTDSPEPSSYWAKVKVSDPQLRPIPTKLNMPSADGRSRPTECASIEQLFRIIQSIPSTKTEPVKRWLARVGFERLEEIDNPELAIKRASMLYRLKGRSEEWIDARMKGIAQRIALTDEWKNRGVKDNEYSVLTSEISKGTFDLSPAEHKIIKGLAGKHKLRDHMTEIELILAMLGEAATRNIAINTEADGFLRNRAAARAGGQVAGAARTRLEKETGKSVVSKTNYLSERQKKNVEAQKGRGTFVFDSPEIENSRPSEDD